MLGATPKKLQISMTLGVIAISCVIGLIIGLLHKAFRIGSPNLVAPQAGLMAGVVKGVLGGELLWPFLLAGMVLALILILIDLPILPIAIGIYLPFTLSVPIFAGGVVRYLTELRLKKKFGSADEEEINDWELAVKQKGISSKDKAIRTGLLFTAGLIAGEALTGVLIAILIVMGIGIAIFSEAPWLPGIVIWTYIAILLAYIPLRETKS
jgi:uncharacterized oligopeptide transporter (OPT) family protein